MVRKNKTRRNIVVGVVIIILLALMAVAFVLGPGDPVSISYQGKEVEVVVPQFGSYRCEKVDVGNPSHNVPEEGFFLSADNLGTFTNEIRDILVVFPETILSRRFRIKYKVCTADEKDCGEEKLLEGGIDEQTLTLPNIDTTEESYWILTERLSVSGLFFTYYPASVSVAFDKYGLNLYDTTQGFGETICETGCDLSCPDSEFREALVSTPENVVDFDKSVSYLSHWIKPALVGEQFGGAIWNPSDNLFCFGGFTYEPGVLDMENGDSFIFPDKYTGNQEDCCPGAVADLTQGKRICNDNYEWEDLGGQEIPCISDLNCPGKGQDSCTKDGDTFKKASWGCVDNFCEEGKETLVDCCPISDGCVDDQVCQDFTCVGGSVVPPLEDCRADADCKSREGGTCELGKCIYPDEKSVCSNCDAYVRSKLFGSFVKSQKCKKKFLQGNVICWLSWIKYLATPLVFIAILLISLPFWNKFEVLKDKKGKKRGIFRVLLSLFIATLISIFFLISFFVGIILLVVYLILRVVLEFFL